MLSRKYLLLTACCGILGTLALMIYFTAPFWLMPVPLPTAPVSEVMAFGREYHTVILWDTWLQQFGSLLTVLFFLALVQLAGVAGSFVGRLTLLVSGIIMALSLAEGSFVLGALQAGENGHPESSLTCIDLANVFVHIFLLAPSLFLVSGIALKDTRLLPRMFSRAAIGLGLLFQVLGVAGLFNSTALAAVIFVLVAQNAWTLAAASVLLQRGLRYQHGSSHDASR